MKEPYLTKIKKQKYLSSFSRFRAGSHALEIERGRYTNPRTPRAQRLCVNCNKVEDEIHFLIHCKLYENQRTSIFQNSLRKIPWKLSSPGVKHQLSKS